MPIDDLLQTVPKLISRIDSLELDLKQTKLTMGNAIVKLVKKVKKLEGKYCSIELNTVIEQDSTAGENKGQREGKAPMLSEETPKKTKEQILQEEASLAEAIRLDSLQKEEEAKQIHLDALLAQRIAEEEELTEQQKKRKAQVQFEAQHYTNEDWDLIRAKLEANAELSKSMLGSELQRRREQAHDPITAKDLHDELLKESRVMEVKSAEEFERDYGKVAFQTKLPKRLKEEKGDEAKDDESTKKSGKRRKQMARKGMNTNVDENDSEESDKVDEQEESNTEPTATGKEGWKLSPPIIADDLLKITMVYSMYHGLNKPKQD
ncbi:hypothetical protein Tco_0127789 [Tanacetum coccineum]